MKRILITGGAGFVGSNLALSFKRDHPGTDVIAFDNLYRPGSELNLPRLEAGGVSFVKGDVRFLPELEAVGPVDVLVECSAEPSVHAGYGGDPLYLLDTNLVGAINCLEFLRRAGGDLVFISTSRVYPIKSLSELPLRRMDDRFDLPPEISGVGYSHEGISEKFPMDGGRSLYGASKLSAELLIQEYAEIYGLRTIIDRCGVIAGPWQMGKVDQGFVSLWVARHVFGGTLNYIGYDGEGIQVRDILHPDDLYRLLLLQLEKLDVIAGRVFNVGGGREVSVSLLELTELCREITGKTLDIGAVAETRAADVPYYVSDTKRIREATGWSPERSVSDIVADTHRWILENRQNLEKTFTK